MTCLQIPSVDATSFHRHVFVKKKRTKRTYPTPASKGAFMLDKGASCHEKLSTDIEKDNKQFFIEKKYKN